MSSNKKNAKPRSAARKQQNNSNNGSRARNKSAQQPPARQRVMAPTSFRQITRIAPALVTSSRPRSDGRITVSHRELIAEVKSFTDFTARMWSINPGLADTFPWLAGIARNYDCYQFRSLSFEFSTMKSTTSTGSVMMAVDYDAADAVPNSKQELLTFHNAVTGALWAPLNYVCDPMDLKKFGPQRFNRADPVAAVGDIKTYDIGNLIVASNGCTAAENDTLLGELWVNYVVDLITPGSLAPLAPDSLKVTSYAAGGATPSNPIPFNSSSVEGYSQVKFKADGTFELPDEGDYLLDIIGTGTGITAGPVWTYASGIIPNPIAAVINAAGTIVAQSYGFKATSGIPSLNTITMTNIAATTLAGFVLRLTRYNNKLI